VPTRLFFAGGPRGFAGQPAPACIFS
jgi:hypothetical protein